MPPIAAVNTFGPDVNRTHTHRRNVETKSVLTKKCFCLSLNKVVFYSNVAQQQMVVTIVVVGVCATIHTMYGEGVNTRHRVSYGG